MLNVQSLNGDIAATALAAEWSGVETSFAINVDGDVTGGTVINGGRIVNGVALGGNALVAAAYGADAANAASLDVGTLGTSDGDFASAMNLTNVQEVTEGSSITAQAAGEAVVYTGVEDDLTASTVTTSFNTVQALAYANRAANSVTVSGNGIDTEADFFPIRGDATVDEDGSSTDASFSLNNAQVAGGDIAATLLDAFDGKDASTSAAVFTVIGDDVLGSSIASNGNTLSAGATGNRADNLLDLSGNGLATTSAIANFQVLSEEAEVTCHRAARRPAGSHDRSGHPGHGPCAIQHHDHGCRTGSHRHRIHLRDAVCRRERFVASSNRGAGNSRLVGRG